MYKNVNYRYCGSFLYYNFKQDSLEKTMSKWPLSQAEIFFSYYRRYLRKKTLLGPSIYWSINIVKCFILRLISIFGSPNTVRLCIL